MTPKYARVERELRYRLPDVPALPADCRVLHLRDRYLVRTRLRLRRATEAGQQPLLKLGQKVRLGGSPPALAHTTMYLTDAEHEVLAALPAHELRKRRHLVPVGDGLVVAVDVFEDRLAGLVTAEVDLGERAVPLTDVVDRDGVRRLLAGGVDVSDDERHTGGALAAAPAPPPLPGP